MMERPKVSVIIPVYGVERYIGQCARSLFAQTLDEVEYIFINDRTPDGSIDVLRRVMAEHPAAAAKVRIIDHAENRGVSVARQHGLDAARGEYVIHCDPDDWVEPDMYARLYAEARRGGYDMVMCDFMTHEGDSVMTHSQRPGALTSGGVLEGITGVSPSRLHGNLWAKLIRADVARRAEFPEGINFCEDLCVLGAILERPLRISHIPAALYHYRIGLPGSLVSIADSRALEMDRRLIALLYSRAEATASAAYRACMMSAVTSVIFNRAFCMGRMADGEFRDKYGQYAQCVDFNRQIRRRDRRLLLLAMKGRFALARGTYDALRELIRRIKGS